MLLRKFTKKIYFNGFDYNKEIREETNISLQTEEEVSAGVGLTNDPILRALYLYNF